MKYLVVLFVCALAALSFVTSAHAGDAHGWKGKKWGWGDRYLRHPHDDHVKIDIGTPYYRGGRQCDNRPVYYAPQPVYYYPQPVYYAPPPRPVYYYNPGGVTIRLNSR